MRNLELFRNMEEWWNIRMGAKALRAKIDMASPESQYERSGYL